MRTVPSLCAFGAGIALAPTGLVFVRESHQQHTTPAGGAMTTTAALYSQHHDVRPSRQPLSALPFSFSSPFSRNPRSLGDGSPLQHVKTRSEEAKVGQRAGMKRALTPRDSFSQPTMERPTTQASGARAGDGTSARPRTGTPSSVRPQSWLRRLSSNTSASRDHEDSPHSRPGSASVSQSNASAAYSPAATTSSTFSHSSTAPSLAPNKLVKRSSSLLGANRSSPIQTPTSRLPISVFRRPSTSRKRSTSSQIQSSISDAVDRMSLDDKPADTRDNPFQLYFTPKVADEPVALVRGKNSTGIPNPIKRMYPDRKHKPMLVSAKESIQRGHVETDSGIGISADELDDGTEGAFALPVAGATPSPASATPSSVPESRIPRRSFSISDLLSSGPRPQQGPASRSSRGAKPSSGSKLVRKAKQRVVSAPQPAMGSLWSRPTDTDSERPAKRRDLTDPQLAQRSIYSSSPASSRLPLPHRSRNGQVAGVPTLSAPSASQTLPLVSDPLADEISLASPAQRKVVSVTPHVPAASHSTRLSATQSDFASFFGSDSDKSTGDASTDGRSDTIYDSIPTRTTRSSIGKRGPHIETIFDESPPQFVPQRSIRLRDLLDDGIHAEHAGRYTHATIDEEENVLGTPRRSMRNHSVNNTPSVGAGAEQCLFRSSPPSMQVMPDPDEIDWDAPEESRHGNGLGTHDSPTQQAALPFFLVPELRQPTEDEGLQRSQGSDRARLFDWSEAQPSPNHNSTPPRPRTVHGKKDPENRGSRSAGRRAPSGMHARSHSVPVGPDVESKRSAVVVNKFGTWGVGSKAVTEDWNEDFDFDEPVPSVPTSEMYPDERRVDSGHVMFVPRSIREQQENVVANISLLREWGLLIEELKELRVRAAALDMIHGSHAREWQEVDAMIELADQESEEVTLEPRRSPPSSPGFDYSAFEETLLNVDNTSWSLDPAVRLPGPAFPQSETETRATGPHSITPQKAAVTAATIVTRPRKDSEAVARSVIEALQAKRSVSDPTTALPPAPGGSKKVPFDTATLRHIVPYVNGLKRKVKNSLREAEGLYTSPRRRVSPGGAEDALSPFQNIFDGPDTPTVHRLSRRTQPAADHDEPDLPMSARIDDAHEDDEDVEMGE